MTRKPKTRFSSRKRTAAGISVVLAVVILLGGTYAWQSMNEQGNSAAKGQPGPAGGRLHDDWEVVGADYGIAEWSENLTANKDIYVENYESDGLDNGGASDNSEVGRDIFVRVKLYEYMEIGEGATLDPGDTDYATRTAQPLIAGTDRDDLSTWSPRVPGVDIASDQFRARWNWTFGGQKTYMPTFNKDSHSQETDIKGDAIDPNDPLTTGEPMNQTKRGGDYPYAYPATAGAPDAGTHDYFDTVTTWQAPEKIWDETLGSGGSGDHGIGGAPVEHTAKATENGSVITMAQWKTSPYNSQKGNYWVVDTDGWFYWANPIAPETATGLLLDSITLQGEPDNEWYYCVYVKNQAATGGDWMQGSDGNGFYVDPGEQPSADAENLLNIITDHLPAVAGVYLSQTTAAVDVNGSLSLTAQVTTENTEDAAWKAVTWSITPGVGSRFSNGIFSPSATDADKWFTIKATSVKDPLKYAECRVYVPKTDQGVVVGTDGNVYLYYVGGDDNTYQKVNPDGTLGSLVCPIEVGNPGAPTDRTNVVTIGSQHYLDEGDDKHYYAVGPDGKLGTADDVLVYDSDGNGTMLPSEDVVNMTISPANPSVMVGDELNLTVTAIFEGGAQDISGVTWAIISTGHAPGTVVTGTGGTITLAADENESKTAITVRATYPGEHGTSKDVTVSVSHIPVAMTGSYTDTTGIKWLKIARAGDKELWVSEKVYGRNGLGTVPGNYVGYASGGFKLYPNADMIKPLMDTWYNTYVSAELKAMTCLPNLTYEAAASGAGFDAAWNLDVGISKPGSLAGATTADVVFPLSISELNRFIGATNASHRAFDTGGNDMWYWLRSPGRTGSYGSRINQGGAVDGQMVDNNTSGIRPAMWVDTTP